MTSPISSRPGGLGLGRRFVGHDPRNLHYLSRPLLDALPVARVDTYWPMPGYGRWPLNQLDSPECTGFGSAHELAAGPVVVPGIDTAYAQHRYARNVEEDHKRGNDFPEGATVEATMAALKADNLITGYVWNKGLDDTIDALCTVGPQCLGTTWKSGMFGTTLGGRLQVTGRDVGGHFFLLLARVEHHPEFGTGCWMLNSWGTWGVGVPQLGLSTGCAFIVDDDLTTLLAEAGESVCARDLYTAPVVAVYYATSWSRVFHRPSHLPVHRDRAFPTAADAVAAGLRACKICRPT